MKTITIKLTKANYRTGPFDVMDQHKNIIAENVPLNTLKSGISYNVNDDVIMITLKAKGKCTSSKTHKIGIVTPSQIVNNTFTLVKTGCLWRHLTNATIYNNFYGNIEPYIIEHPFAYQFQDQILQNVKDYTKAFQYFPDGTGVFSLNDKIEVDDKWFNQAVVYNNQQSSGILNLVPKPRHNMKAYMSYPKFNSDSKDIIYTKSDNFYQYNTFWSIVKDKNIPLFLTSCESLSLDKVVNQDNMDYGLKSFKKATLRAKDLKIRHLLTNRSDVNLVSQIVITPTQISYK